MKYAQFLLVLEELASTQPIAIVSNPTGDDAKDVVVEITPHLKPHLGLRATKHGEFVIYLRSVEDEYTAIFQELCE